MKTVRIILFCLLCFLILFNEAAEATNRKRVAILDFEVGQTEYMKLGQMVAQNVELELSKNKSYQTIAGEKCRQIMEKYSPHQTENANFSSWIGLGLGQGKIAGLGIGKEMNLDYIIVGTVRMDQEQSQGIRVPFINSVVSTKSIAITVDVYVLDVRRNATIMTAHECARETSLSFWHPLLTYDEWKASDMGKAADAASKKVAEELNKINPPRGSVIKTEEKAVYIDLGSNHGIERGQEFLLYKEGEVFKHPKTGAILMVEEIEIGHMRIKEVEENIAIGEVDERTVLTRLTPGEVKVKRWLQEEE